ncbi:MAG TPA: zf-HC2 domain-containing protein [Gemmatimonadaceae bacterium]|jgi:hypothetical protein|nr:zf-HC2 domain-containing protein [Gemmatimonadaceae bacterium]
MNDCTNAEIRDRLPDLLHERLDASARAAVVSHVAECVDCTDELRLLREVRAAIESGTPRVDLNYVIGALPKAPVQGMRRLEPRRRVWADWRVAAAVTLLVAGGGSAALLSRTNAAPRKGAATPALVADVPVTPAAANAAAESASATQPVAAPVSEATVADAGASPSATSDAADANLTNLDESQLKTLLQDIDKLPAVPVADPEPVSLRINARTTGDI